MADGGVDEASGPISDMDRTDRTDAVLDSRGTLPLTMESCQLGDGADETPWRLFGLGCEQGTLFILRQDPWQRKPAFGPDENDVDPSSHAAHRTTCVLVAQLNDSHRISDAMLPDGFRDWVNRVWEASDDVAKAFAGTRSGVSGSRIYYVFREGEVSASIFKAICCATQMNHRMQALEKRLLEQGEWAGDIRLNIGINHGEYLSADENAADSLPHMIPGDAFDQASLLAGMASAGEIWISKGTAASLSASHIHQVVLGVEHQGTFLRNRFVRLTVLPRFGHRGHSASDTASLSAAKVIKVEHPGTDLPVTNEVQS
jgi:class 3 adenylate cyclase